MTPKRVYSFMIEPEMAAALKVVKDRDGIPESEQIRRGIQLWLDTRGVKAGIGRKPAASRKHP